MKHKPKFFLSRKRKILDRIRGQSVIALAWFHAGISLLSCGLLFLGIEHG